MLLPNGFFDLQKARYKAPVSAIANANQYPVANIFSQINALTGSEANGWATGLDIGFGKIALDFGESVSIKKIIYNNYHHFGGLTGLGVKDYELRGSNNSNAFNANFSDISDSDLVELGQMLQHQAGDAEQLRTIEINTPFYRFYTLRFLNTQNPAEFFRPYLGIRRLEFYMK